MKIIKREFDDLNIPFYLLNSSPEELAKDVIENNIGGIVCDFYPLKYPRKLTDTFLKNIPKDVPVVQVSCSIISIDYIWVIAHNIFLVHNLINKGYFGFLL